jgi:hypothetical protein
MCLNLLAKLIYRVDNNWNLPCNVDGRKILVVSQRVTHRYHVVTNSTVRYRLQELKAHNQTKTCIQMFISASFISVRVENPSAHQLKNV